MTRKLLSSRVPSPLDERRPSPFHAVEIRCTQTSCAAARRLRGQRYLSADAPLLPLDDCDRGARCGCSYRHEPDRRRGARRSDEAGLPPTRKLDVREKRSAARRRVDDHDPADDFDDPLDDTYYDFVARKLD